MQMFYVRTFLFFDILSHRFRHVLQTDFFLELKHCLVPLYDIEFLNVFIEHVWDAWHIVAIKKEHEQVS